jgi:hypothetical protein
MSVPISLRGDFNAAQLRALAKKTKDGPQARRLLALAVIYDGGTRSEAAKLGRDLVLVVQDFAIVSVARFDESIRSESAPRLAQTDIAIDVPPRCPGVAQKPRSGSHREQCVARSTHSANVSAPRSIDAGLDQFSHGCTKADSRHC